MRSMTRFSVVIPTRGRHHFLKQAITSVLAQRHAAHEIIVADDGEGAADAVGQCVPIWKLGILTLKIFWT